MWSVVVVLGLLSAVDPLRLGVTLLMISRPRTMQSLLAYWVGGVLAGVAAALVPLVALRFAPSLTNLITNAIKSPAVGQVQIAFGVVALSVAAALTVAYSARERAALPVPRGNPTTLMPRPSRPAVFGRLLGRTRDAWEDGSSWVAFAVGIGSGPPPVEYFLALPAIVASGAALVTQIIAVVTFVIAMFVLVEIALLSYLVAPVRTQRVVLRVHDWVRAHRRQLLVVFCAVVGASLVTSGAIGA